MGIRLSVSLHTLLLGMVWESDLVSSLYTVYTVHMVLGVIWESDLVSSLSLHTLYTHGIALITGQIYSTVKGSRTHPLSRCIACMQTYPRNICPPIPPSPHFSLFIFPSPHFSSLLHSPPSILYSSCPSGCQQQTCSNCTHN